MSGLLKYFGKKLLKGRANNLNLDADEFEQISMVPTGVELFVFDVVNGSATVLRGKGKVGIF